MKFRKKPVVVEAWQIPLDRDDKPLDTPPWIIEAVLTQTLHLIGPGGRAYIKTLEGRMAADPGDWIIKGVKGELYACKPDIFAATYEPAS